MARHRRPRAAAMHFLPLPVLRERAGVRVLKSEIPNPKSQIQKTLTHALSRSTGRERRVPVTFHLAVSLALVFALATAAARAQAPSDWPRFRGPNGGGAAADANPPVTFAPDKNVAWKRSLPPGHSSPVVSNGRVYLTAIENNQLLTLCLDAATGEVRWRKPAPADQLEKSHPSGSPASSTPVADGKNVYAYFASYGLLAYDAEGNELWKRPLPPPTTMFGSGTSPILAGGRVVLVTDSDAGVSRVTAFDPATGSPAWKTARPLFRGGWSTPIVWSHDKVEELIVLGSGRLLAYDVATGTQRWWVGGFPQQVISSPVAGADLLFAAKGGQGDPGQSLVNELPKWDALLKDYDANADGRIAADELPDDFGIHQRKEVPVDAPGNFLSIRTLVGMIDGNKDGAASRFEWAMATTFLSGNEDVLLAIKPGAGAGTDATATHVAWKQRRAIPEIPTPLFYDGRLYLVKNGGIVSCLDPATGNTVYRQRLAAGGHYAASPVAANGKIYAVNEAGVVTVFKAGDALETLSENDLAERVMATPAIVGDTIYVRTASRLYAFRGGDK